jgi:hypothetical protein
MSKAVVKRLYEETTNYCEKGEIPKIYQEAEGLPCNEEIMV